VLSINEINITFGIGFCVMVYIVLFIIVIRVVPNLFHKTLLAIVLCLFYFPLFH
jgi:hypothetical protein